jgi:hypothetical protein
MGDIKGFLEMFHVITVHENFIKYLNPKEKWLFCPLYKVLCNYTDLYSGPYKCSTKCQCTKCRQSHETLGNGYLNSTWTYL